MKLETDNLSFSYGSYDGKSSKELFSSLSFSLEERENLLVLSPPGAGKTTLSLILSSLIPSLFEGKMSGRVLLDGKELAAAPNLLGSLSLVPQDSSAFLITTSVEDEIAYPLESLGLDTPQMKRRVDEALEEWGLEELRNASPEELSGGEKRRVMLACAYVTEPSIVILDEAFDDLDPLWRGRLAKKISERSSSTLLFASHSLPLFEGLFDRVLTLENGGVEDAVIAEDSLPRFEIKRSGRGENLLEADNITFERKRRSTTPSSFRLSVPSFHLRSGEIVTLSGANGSGKSTFSRLLSGLESPDGGSFTLNGKAAEGPLRSRKVGYMFQNPDFQIFLPTVRDELSYSLEYLSLSESEKEKRLERVADLFSLELESTAALLSFGVRKRLQAAIYYNLERPFYILDELDSALSYEEAVKIVSLLSERGSGILLITHDELFARSLKERSYRAEEGNIHEE